MPKIHFLNVKLGDCIILEHSSGRVSIFDISAGNIERQQRSLVEEIAYAYEIETAKGNFQMCNHPTNPLDYLSDMQNSEIWRFILSHPDMDHLDGFNALLDDFNVLHFWDSGAEKNKPDFNQFSGYNEEDWDRYVKVKANSEPDTKSILVQSGNQFKFANQDETENGVGDSLYILSPSQNMIDESNDSQDFNDASYVILYKSEIGNVLLTGDSHDATWDFIEEHYKAEVSNVDLLIAPHHGRKSGRSYKFLDYVNPKLTLFGCAPSEHVAYDAWNYRNLKHITNNQCGCIVAEGVDIMDVYVENKVFADKSGGNINRTNEQDFYYLCTVG